MTESPPPTAGGIRVVAFPPAWRAVAAALLATSRLSLFLMALTFALGWVISPPLLVRLVLFLALIPGLAVVLIRRVFLAEVEAQGSGWVLRRLGLYRRGELLSLDRVGFDAVRPWMLPLPGPGLSLTAAAGAARLRLALQASHPSRLLDRLAMGQPSALPAHASAALDFAAARADSRLLRWHQPLLKFGLFGLLPLFVVFRLHQNVMWGGLLGQYHLQGLAPYLSSLAYHAIMMLMTLVLYAAFWRGLAELSCWLAALRWRSGARRARSLSEGFTLAIYYAGIPAFIVWRSMV